MDIDFQFALFLRERASELHPEHTGWLEELTSKQSQGSGRLCCVPVSTSAVMSQGSGRLCNVSLLTSAVMSQFLGKPHMHKFECKGEMGREEKRASLSLPTPEPRNISSVVIELGGERAKAPPCNLSSAELTELLNRLCWSHMGQGCPCFYYKNSKTHHS